MKTPLLILSTAALILFSTAIANGQTDVFTDTFDAAPTNGATRVFSPDNTANNGTFPSSASDVFGIVDRNVNFSFADDSLTFETDTMGIIQSGKTDFFLGFQDTLNCENPDPTGTVTVTWTAAPAGLTDLNLSFEIAAMGDFEAADLLEVTASFDGGAAQTVFMSATDEDGAATYTLESGTTVDLVDPFAIDGQPVVNEFQAFSFPITGSGSNLTLTLSYAGNGGSEVMAIDNLSVTSGGDMPGLVGDVNCDGDVNFLDIAPFIAVLSMSDFVAKADINLDGEVNFLDISPFISLLTSQ